MYTSCCWNAIRRLFCLDVDDDQVQPVRENQEDEAAELIAAAQEGPLPDKVLSILEEDPWLIRIGDPKGDTVVHIAARAGDVVTVCKLIAFIQERKDLELKRVLTDVNFEGDTALHLALKNNHQEVAYHLVKAGHKAAYMFNNNKVSPLTLAREAGFSEVLSAIPEPIPDDQVQLALEIQEDDDDVNDGAERLAAAQQGPRPDAVLSILEKDPGLIRIGDPVGDTVFHIAARAGDVVTICKLIAFIEERNDLDLKRVFTDVNVEGDTALHLALKNSHREVAYHLVKAGHEAAYMFNNDEVSPLRLAREAGFSEVLSAIPEDDDDQVLLALEIEEDDDDVNEVAELLAADQQGPRPDASLSILEKDPALHKRVFTDVNVEGDTALHLALKNGYQEVEYLICGSSLADIEMGIVKRKLVELLCRSVFVQWDELYTAIINGSQDVIVKGLMRDGKKLLLYQPQSGETLLHVAAANSRVDPLRQLVKFMINNNLHHAALLKDNIGDTALHRTLKGGSLSAARYLIKAVPETVYKVNDNGVSPLYLAVKAGNKDLVIYMMSHCRLPACATEILGHHKHTTLAHLAIKARSFGTSLILSFSVSSSMVPKSTRNTRRLDKGTLKTLVEHLPELIKMTDEKGWSALSFAANKGYLEEVTYFLTHFPRSATKCDRDGSFPIHKAISRGHVSIIKAFLAHCPQELYRVDKKGRSVLHIAVRYKDYARDDDILAYLMKEVKMDEAFLNLQDNEGKTFRDHAKDVKHSF